MAKNELIDFPNLRMVLEEYGKAVVDYYKDNLTNGNNIASKELINSVRYIASFGERTFEISLNLAEQWKWLEYGTRPHWPPFSDPENGILKWVHIKPVIPRMSNGKLPTEKQLAFLIARSISEKGTKAYKVMEKTIDTINKEYLDKIYDAIDRDLENSALIIINNFIGKSEI